MEIVKIFSAMLTPVIAIVTVSILVLQYKLQRYKLRHELYGLRLRVYQAVNAFIIHVLQNGTAKNEELSNLIQNTGEAQFLFKGSIKEYIQTLHGRGLRIQLLSTRLQNRNLPAGEKRNKTAEHLEVEFNWFATQLNEVNTLFGEYLTLDK